MDAAVKKRFESYPDEVAEALAEIRLLILSTAESDGITDLVETTKWNEPSYVAKKGSTIRFDWKAKEPDQYCMYFSCQSSLVETFREVYGDVFEYSGNRALIFKLGEPVPSVELRHCISMALRYKQIKHLHLLGA